MEITFTFCAWHISQDIPRFKSSIHLIFICSVVWDFWTSPCNFTIVNQNSLVVSKLEMGFERIAFRISDENSFCSYIIEKLVMQLASDEMLFGPSSLNIVDIEMISARKYLFNAWLAPIDIINIHLISDESEWLWRNYLYVLQLVNRIQRILRWPIRLEFHAVGMGALDIAVEQTARLAPVQANVQSSWL